MSLETGVVAVIMELVANQFVCVKFSVVFHVRTRAPVVVVTLDVVLWLNFFLDRETLQIILVLGGAS